MEDLGGHTPPCFALVTLKANFRLCCPSAFVKGGAQFFAPFNLTVYFQKNYQKRKGEGLLSLNSSGCQKQTSPWYLILHWKEAEHRRKNIRS